MCAKNRWRHAAEEKKGIERDRTQTDIPRAGFAREGRGQTKKTATPKHTRKS